MVNVSFSAKKRAINGFGASATLARGAARCIDHGVLVWNWRAGPSPGPSDVQVRQG